MNVKLLLPPELLRHDHWVEQPKSEVDDFHTDKTKWGKYQEGERDWFVVTPDIGIVVALTVVDGRPHQRWGLGKFPEGVCLIKMTRTLGMLISSSICIHVPQSEHWQPFVSFQNVIDALASNRDMWREAKGGEVMEEVKDDLGFN